MPLVERRYAEALVDISEQAGAVDVFQHELQTVVDLLDNQADFKFFVLNPEIRIETKKAVFRKLFGNRAKPDMLNFLLLLIDKGRIKSLPGILREFVKLADKKRSILNMTIISAAPLSESQINRIKEKYRGAYNALAVSAEVRIDESLIGGVKVIIGDKVVDGSVKGRLESLKAVIAR